MSREVAAHVGELQARGFTIVEGAYGEDEVERLQATMRRLHDEAGRPRCYAREPREIATETELSTTGLVFYKFLRRSPDDAELVVKPAVADAVRGFLGSDATLEVAGAVICDPTRPFFAWHTHIGGPDDSRYRRERIFPRFERPERVMTLLYLDDIDEDNGPILVLPRRVTDPTPPPHDLGAASWPGEVTLTPRRGSVLVLDQCTWHAVRQKRSPGLRSFVGCYFRSPAAPATEWVDTWLPTFTGGGELLQSLLPRR